jgi:hypothetical protein
MVSGRTGGPGQLFAMVALACLVLINVAGCATTRETSQQAYVWQMGRICDANSPFWRMERVEADGRYWVQGAANAPPGRNEYVQCMQEQFKKTPYRAWLRERSGSLESTPVAPSSSGSVTSSTATTTQSPLAKTSVGPRGERALKPTWTVGDEWSYRWQSPEGKGTFVWVVDRFENTDGIDSVVIKSGSRESFYRREDGALRHSTVNGRVESRYDPPFLSLPFPLEVGKQWHPDFTRERPAAQRTTELLLDCRVEGEESVTVPAGTFRTFHVICNNQRSKLLNFELWYAPEVGNMVKERTRFSYGIRERELAGFKFTERPQ